MLKLVSLRKTLFDSILGSKAKIESSRRSLIVDALILLQIYFKKDFNAIHLTYIRFGPKFNKKYQHNKLIHFVDL